MTEAGWTRKKPTVEGFYWHRDPDSLVLSMIYVTLSGEPTVIYTCSGFKMSLAEHSRCSSEWLGPITPDSYQQGRVASLVAMKDYLETRADIVEGAALRELLAGNSVKESNERSALAEIHAMQSVIRDLEAQQAQEGGVGGCS